MRRRTLTLAAVLVLVAASAAPAPADGWRSHARRRADAGERRVHHHDREPQLEQHELHQIPRNEPYWGTMRPYWGTTQPYWGSNEPPGVIHRVPRTRDLKK